MDVSECLFFFTRREKKKRKRNYTSIHYAQYVSKCCPFLLLYMTWWHTLAKRNVLLELIEYCVCVVSQKTNHCCDKRVPKKTLFQKICILTTIKYDRKVLNDWFSIHYGENFMNNKLMVNNLAVQYVNWNLKKITLTPLFEKKMWKKRRKP